MELINEIWPYVSNHTYFFLFIGMLMGGEAFLLPAIFLAIKGTVNFYLVLLFSILATLISDTAWYIIGRFFPLERILLWKIFLKKRELSDKIFLGLQKHGLKILFISKFVYGTRTLVQVLSGTIRTPFFKYSIVNLSGILSYLFTISFITFLIKESLDSFIKITYNEYAYLVVFILVIGILHICLKKWFSKKLLASSSRLGMKNEQ
jgi:membrane protein DedA with SNARE-associated domain